MKALRRKKNNVPKKGRWDVFWSNADRPTMRYEVLGFTPKTGQWRYSKERAEAAISNYKTYEKNYAKTMSLEEYYSETGIDKFIRRIPNGKGKNGGVQHWVAPSDTVLRTSNWIDIEVSQIGKEIDIPFSNPKNKELLMELIKLSNMSNEDIVLDFFSGSATTAHAVMELNAKDDGNRKYIMVQLPEETEEESEAYKAGYKNICEIGKERIRRAGKKIKEDYPDSKFDDGFRVLRVDSSNMKDVYHKPEDYSQSLLDKLETNIKEDRNEEDLLFQVMLSLGIDLSSKIEKEEINDNKVLIVEDGFLISCFDEEIFEETVESIAKKQPYYAVFSEGKMSDSTLANFEQIFDTYSPTTIRKVI
jgi:adenine-specific DNA-methyltransferase